MIVDFLSNARLYHVLGPRFAAAFDYLARTDFTTLANGRYDVQGDDVFAMVQSYDSKLLTPASKWEAHRTYADIQYIVSGQERMGYTQIGSLKVTDPYDATKDFELYTGQPDQTYDYVRVSPGMFTIFLPTDAHMPGVALNQPEKVSKVVMKVRY
jgi:biofilm protein TabA